jgi:hypothetical protein
MINIGVCAQLIYVIPVISTLFVVSKTNGKNKKLIEILIHVIESFFSKLGFDDCSINPCPSGTICLDTKDGFSCICPPWHDDCTYGKRDFFNLA